MMEPVLKNEPNTRELRLTTSMTRDQVVAEIKRTIEELKY